MDIYNNFIKKFITYIYVEGRSINSYQDLMQDCALIYFSNPEIEELFLEERYNNAYSVFISMLRKELKKYNAINMGLASRKRNVEIFQNRLAIMFAEMTAENEYSSDFETLENKLALQDLIDNKIISQNSVDVAVEYLEYGSRENWDSDIREKERSKYNSIITHARKKLKGV